MPALATPFESAIALQAVVYLKGKFLETQLRHKQFPNKCSKLPCNYLNVLTSVCSLPDKITVRQLTVAIANRQ
ncbi:MAG: hypothetical protein HC849_13430 [Oscillatoriales cyanobacterium RU_3_3]|nr:hypothetical protein [Microcoleus sp. SU_5_6]NJL65706.1 hypothetical protein [Microcoleus sp. SM1_3_4]NJM60978.1 hypothetical protein [Oscillatoriales cyanobacterium RU_3_3]NJR24813.1 hypothetical protein [Richelia sp. CSU_2_1]